MDTVEQEHQELLCILLLEPLHHLHLLLHAHFEYFVISSVLRIFELEKELGDFALVPDQVLGQDEEEDLEDCRNVASVSEIFQSDWFVVDKGWHLVIDGVAALVVSPVAGIARASIHVF